MATEPVLFAGRLKRAIRDELATEITALDGSVGAVQAQVEATDAQVAEAQAQLEDNYLRALMIADWIELTLDVTGRPVEGTKADGSLWRANGGELQQVFPDPRSLAETVLVLRIADFETVTVDASGRAVEAVDADGRRYAAIDGEFRLLDPADSGAGMSLIDWLDLSVDDLGRPVEGTDVRGRQYIAIDGEMRRLDNLAVNATLVAMGDSTTAGADLVSPLTDRWTTLLAAQLGIPINNRGVSGQRAEEIAARMGAEMVTGRVTGGSIPATGSVQITGLAINPTRGGGVVRVNARLHDLTIVPGMISYVSDTVVSFTALGLAAPVSADYVDLIATFEDTAQNSVVFIGAGINNEPLIVAGTQTLDQLKGWYRKMTSALRTNPRRIVVWGVLDRGVSEAAGTAIGDLIRQLEPWLVAEYGFDYCPVRQYLASQRALDEAAIVEPGFVSTSDDNTAVAAGVVPPSFRANAGTVHLGPLGHKMQALCLRRHITHPSRQWMLAF